MKSLLSLYFKVSMDTSSLLKWINLLYLLILFSFIFLPSVFFLSFFFLLIGLGADSPGKTEVEPGSRYTLRLHRAHPTQATLTWGQSGPDSKTCTNLHCPLCHRYYKYKCTKRQDSNLIRSVLSMALPFGIWGIYIIYNFLLDQFKSQRCDSHHGYKNPATGVAQFNVVLVPVPTCIKQEGFHQEDDLA